MGSSGNNLIKSVVALRKENEELQELINYIEMENFEYALKVNRIENTIKNTHTIICNNNPKLVEASENLAKIFEACNEVPAKRARSEVPPANRKTMENTCKVDSPRSNKAHAVKPHMVNGTVLYVPTISLTRVSDLQMQTKSHVSEAANTSSASKNSSISSLSNVSVEIEPSASTSQSFNDDHQSVHLETFSEPSTSKSSSHSTVLSGTFQEVKIFMNQVSQEKVKVKEEPRASVTLRRGNRSQNKKKL